MRVWDAAAQAELAALRGHTGTPWSVAFSPDGRRVASGGGDGTVRLWDAATGAGLAPLRGHTGWVLSASFSPDGGRVVSRDLKGTTKVWDASTGREIPGPLDFPVDAVGGHRHGQRLVVPQGDTVVVVDLRPPDEWALAQRSYHARVNPWWHQEQADAAAKANDPAAVAFHRGWVATAWPDDANAWTQLDAACRQAGSCRHMLAACDRVLDANPKNEAARARRAAYRGSAAAFAAGWPGLAPLADW